MFTLQGICRLARRNPRRWRTYPLIWESQITVQFEYDDLLEEGMAFYIYASMQSFGDKHGMLMGGSYLMAASGPERLNKALIEVVLL